MAKISVRRAFSSRNQDKLYVIRKEGEGSYDENNEYIPPVPSRPMPILGVVNHFSDRDLMMDDALNEAGLEWHRYNAKLTTQAKLKINDRVIFQNINYKVVNFRDYQSSGFSTYLITSHDPLFEEND